MAGSALKLVVTCRRCRSQAWLFRGWLLVQAPFASFHCQRSIPTTRAVCSPALSPNSIAQTADDPLIPDMLAD